MIDMTAVRHVSGYLSGEAHLWLTADQYEEMTKLFPNLTEDVSVQLLQAQAAQQAAQAVNRRFDDRTYELRGPNGRFVFHRIPTLEERVAALEAAAKEKR